MLSVFMGCVLCSCDQGAIKVSVDFEWVTFILFVRSTVHVC